MAKIKKNAVREKAKKRLDNFIFYEEQEIERSLLSLQVQSKKIEKSDPMTTSLNFSQILAKKAIIENKIQQYYEYRVQFQQAIAKIDKKTWQDIQSKERFYLIDHIGKLKRDHLQDIHNLQKTHSNNLFNDRRKHLVKVFQNSVLPDQMDKLLDSIQQERRIEEQKLQDYQMMDVYNLEIDLKYEAERIEYKQNKILELAECQHNLAQIEINQTRASQMKKCDEMIKNIVQYLYQHGYVKDEYILDQRIEDNSPSLRWEELKEQEKQILVQLSQSSDSEYILTQQM